MSLPAKAASLHVDDMQRFDVDDTPGNRARVLGGEGGDTPGNRARVLSGGGGGCGPLPGVSYPRREPVPCGSGGS